MAGRTRSPTPSRRRARSSASGGPPSPELIRRAQATAFQNVFDAVVVTDMSGRIVDWNAGSERLFGYTFDEAVGRPVSMLYVPDDSEHLAAKVIPTVQREGRWQGEIRMLHKEGHIGWIESVCVPVADHAGEPVGTLGINRDISDRVDAERKLRSAEARFRSLVEHSLVGIYIVQDDRLLYVNPKLAEILGYRQDEMLGDLRIFDLVVDEDRDLVRRNVQRRMAGEELQEPYTFRARRKDGQIIHLQVHAGRIQLDEEHAIIGMALDVTEDRLAEARLRASEERLRLVVRAVDDVIWEWEVKTGALTWSDNASRTFRYAPEEVTGSIDWWYGRLHPDDRDRVITKLHAAIEGTDETWSDEYRFRRGDGSYAVILDRGSIQRNEQAEPLKAIGSMMDVTDRRRDEDAQRFLAGVSTILDRSLDPQVTFPELARATVPPYADLCRIDLFEDDGSLRCAGVAHESPAMEPSLLEAAPLSVTTPLADSVRAGQSVVIQERSEGLPERIGDDGPAFDFWTRLEVRSLMVIPLVAREGILGAITLGMAGSGRRYGPPEMLLAEDLARRAAAAVEKARLYDAAQRAIQAREEILRVVSHDLRNPLGTIQMSTDLLGDLAHERRSDHRKWLASISRAVDDMSGMIEDLMDAARIDTGVFSVDPVQYGPAILLEAVEHAFGPLAAEKDIGLECRAADDLPATWLDPQKIQRVLSNLVGNALKFTPTGGTIRLEAVREGEEVRFTVADTGPGIPPEELPHVFDRYWQARKGDRRGVGLGLTIARGIVEAHGGRIWAESDEGGGTAFHFTLPAV